MNYESLYDKAVADGKVKALSSEMITLQEGDRIIGKYLSRELIKSNKRKLPDYYRYTFDTDDGPVTALFNHAFDEDVGSALHEGRVYAIERAQDRQLGGGRRFKVYKVVELQVDDFASARE